jgi:hypothetical protein
MRSPQRANSPRIVSRAVQPHLAKIRPGSPAPTTMGCHSKWSRAKSPRRSSVTINAVVSGKCDVDHKNTFFNGTVNALTLPARQLSSRGPGNHTPDPAGGRLLRLTWGGTRRFIGRLLTGCALARYPAYSAARSKVTTSNDDVLLASKRRRHSDPTEASAQPGAGILPPPFRSFTRAAVSHCGPLGSPLNHLPFRVIPPARTMSGDARPSAYCRQPMKLFRTVTRDGRRKRLFVTPITSFV